MPRLTPPSIVAIGALGLGAWLFSASGCEECEGEHCGEPTGAGASHHGGGAGGTGGAASLAERYCACMLTSCHDAYHDAFGPDSDEEAAAAACLAEAETVPEAGMAVTDGNFIECRLHFCAVGRTDESACPSSVGQDACSDGAGG